MRFVECRDVGGEAVEVLARDLELRDAILVDGDSAAFVGR